VTRYADTVHALSHAGAATKRSFGIPFNAAEMRRDQFRAPTSNEQGGD
jgi:hypothetical protein